jgi:hypothetical protein
LDLQLIMGNTQALTCCDQQAAQSDKLSEVSVKAPSEKEYHAEDVEAVQAAEDISTGVPPSHEEAQGPCQDVEVEPAHPVEEEPVVSDAQAEPSKPMPEEQSAVDTQQEIRKPADEQQERPVSEPQQLQDQPGTQEVSRNAVQLEKAEARATPPKLQEEDDAKSDSKKGKPAKSRGWCLCGSKAGAAVATDRKKQAPSKDSKNDVAAD